MSGISKHITAWALTEQFSWGRSFLGKFCWPGGNDSDLCYRLFRTRQHARDARATCCYKDARPVKVVVSIEEVQP